MNTFSCSAHFDMCSSAFSITMRKPSTRRVIAVPFAVRAGIRLAPINSTRAPITSGIPSSPAS